MAYYIRPMRRGDVDQVNEIDHEAFPTQWPPPNYQRELQNKLAHYIVICDEDKTAELPEVNTPRNGNSGLVSRLRRLFGRNHISEVPPAERHHVIGFAGFWLLAGEAHITGIAVREAYQRQGLGELLLISVTDLAKELKARIITLEVRASNTSAQNLYAKHGFARTGVRRGYYTDNKEDGILMSTQDITSTAFQTHLQRLKQAQSSRWGIQLPQIAR